MPENATMDIEQPQTMLDGNDFEKRFQFNMMKKDRLENICQWKQRDIKGKHKSNYSRSIMKSNNNILKISDKSDMEKLEVYSDRFPFLKLRKSIMKAQLIIKTICYLIIKNKIFDNICLLIIIANSVTMIYDDTATSDNPNPIFAELESTFLILYTIEMVLKIIGYGFITGPEPYIKDAWNILDFFIVMSSYVTVLSEMNQSKDEASVYYPVVEEETKGMSITGLRVFRVMRPLKTISSIKGLKVLIMSVLFALPMLQDTLMILMFFFIVFAIATTQMFNGMLKQRCVDIQTGAVHPDDIMCTMENSESCPGGFFCGKSNENPNAGVTNFDNVSYSFLAVF